MAEAENDSGTIAEIARDVIALGKLADEMEFKRMFAGEMDDSNCYVDIQSGAGGTEGQDWANMLLRMYLKWCDQNGFKYELLEVSDGEVAGIKGASFSVTGAYAYGWLRTETGVHRLVRKSPFDSGGRRHTSFAGVYVSPEVDDRIDIEINPADLEAVTYRSSMRDMTSAMEQGKQAARDARKQATAALSSDIRSMYSEFVDAGIDVLAADPEVKESEEQADESYDLSRVDSDVES